MREWPGVFGRIDPGLGPGAAGLAVDTSGRQPLVGIVDAVGRLHSFEGNATRGPQHGRYIVPVVQELLMRAGLASDDLEFVAAALGPGSFTGLRIGLTAAKVLAYAWKKPLVALDSLDIIAASLPSPPLSFLVATDAQRGDAFVVRFRSDGPLPVREGPTGIRPWPAVLDSNDAIATPASSPWAARLDTLESKVMLQGPSPSGLLRLARNLWTRGLTADPWFLEPTYLRPSAAEEKAAAPQDPPRPS